MLDNSKYVERRGPLTLSTPLYVATCEHEYNINTCKMANSHIKKNFVKCKYTFTLKRVYY